MYLPPGFCARVRKGLTAKELDDAHFVVKVPRVREPLIPKGL